MNSLSWLLYFADVLPGISTTAGFILTLATLVFFATAIGYNIANLDESVTEDTRKFANRLFRNNIFVMVIAAIPFLFIPSKETFYLIAGSEAGEYVVTTPDGKEILGDIKDVIKAQLEDLKGNDSKRTD